MSKIAILIPTRNRPEKITILLDSLVSSTIRPHQIIIVASGVDIKSHLKRYEQYFNICYQFTTSLGQITQKKIGLSFLNKENEWCLFLDDDLIVEADAIENALKAVNSRVDHYVVGVGFSLPTTSRIQNAKLLHLMIGKLFGIRSNVPGKVLRNGHATSYMQEGDIVSTEWLNGASMWRKSVVNTYGLELPSTSYAACEDLIFSYPLRREGELIYAPTAKVGFQEGELSDFDSLKVFESASYWRYYFVCQNQLSQFAFFYSQFGRILFITLRARNRRLLTFHSLVKTQIPLLISHFKRKPHQLLLAEFAES